MNVAKYLFLLTGLLLCSAAVFSQDNRRDSVPDLFDDYSNRKPVDISVMYNDFLKTKESTIVIIDQKIFAIDDKNFKNLDKSKIKSMQLVKDEQSETKIKNVIIITTK